MQDFKENLLDMNGGIGRDTIKIGYTRLGNQFKPLNGSDIISRLDGGITNYLTAIIVP